MKALSFIAILFAAFLIFLGVTSKQTAGGVLGNAVIAGGVIIAVVVAAIWILMFFKEKKGN
jgi:heme/copper-type cytochrome/quinol oxidase subunit 4